MTVYSVKNPHTYVYSSTLPTAIQEKHGFKPITIGGKRYYEFEHCGITTHCRPLPHGGLQVCIEGIDNQALEIHQPNYDEMVGELVTALATIAPSYNRRRTLRLCGMNHLI